MSLVAANGQGGYNLPSQVNGVAPRTTGSGPGNEFASFLGEPRDNYKYNPKEDLPFQTFDGPDAYVGKNVYLEHIIKGLTFSSAEENWQTAAIPLMESNEEHFKWTIWKFNRTLASLVPNEGVARLVTSSKAERSAGTYRHGLALILEGDFARTPEGQTEFRNKLLGMVSCINETIYDDTIHKIFTANDNLQTQRAQHNLAQASLAKMCDFEITQFASINSGPRSFVVLAERYKRMLSLQGVKPDMMIVPPESLIFMSDINSKPEPMPYVMIGANGELLKRDGPMSIKRLPDGTYIFECADVLIDENSPSLQPCMSVNTISEYYLMLWGSNSTRNLLNDKTRKYSSEQRNLVVYNGENDTNEMVPFLEAFRHSKYFNNDVLESLINENNYTPEDFVTKNQYGNKPGPGGLGGSTATHKNANDATLGKRRKAPFTLYWDGMAKIARYFGQLDQDVSPLEITRQVAQTALTGIDGFCEDILRHTQVFRDGIGLLKNLENAPYSKPFFEALYEANVSDNTDPYTMEFKGSWLHDDAPDLVKKWGFRNIHEWRYAPSGTLRLPHKSSELEGITYPPGYASFPGLVELAMAYEDGRGWEIGKLAKTFVDLIRLLYARVQIAFAHSEAVDPLNRPPWYHDPEGIITFFENAIHIPTESLFLAYLGLNKNGEGDNEEEHHHHHDGGDDDDDDAFNPYHSKKPRFVSSPMRTTLENIMRNMGENLVTENDAQNVANNIEKLIATIQSGKTLPDNEMAEIDNNYLTAPILDFGISKSIVNSGYLRIDTPLMLSTYQPTPVLMACAKLGKISLKWFLVMLNHMDKLFKGRAASLDKDEDKEKVNERRRTTMDKLITILNGTPSSNNARFIVGGLTGFNMTFVEGETWLDDTVKTIDTVTKNRRALKNLIEMGSQASTAAGGDPNLNDVDPDKEIMTKNTQKRFNDLIKKYAHDMSKNGQPQHMNTIHSISNEELFNSIQAIKESTDNLYEALSETVIGLHMLNENTLLSNLTDDNERELVNTVISRFINESGSFVNPKLFYAYPITTLGSNIKASAVDLYNETIAKVQNEEHYEGLKKIARMLVSSLKEGSPFTTKLRNALLRLEEREMSFTDNAQTLGLKGFPYTLINPKTNGVIKLGGPNSMGDRPPKPVAKTTYSLINARWYRTSLVCTKALRDYFQNNYYSEALIRPADPRSGYETPYMDPQSSYDNDKENYDEFNDDGIDHYEPEGDNAQGIIGSRYSGGNRRHHRHERGVMRRASRPIPSYKPIQTAFRPGKYTTWGVVHEKYPNSSASLPSQRDGGDINGASRMFGASSHGHHALRSHHGHHTRRNHIGDTIFSSKLKETSLFGGSIGGGGGPFGGYEPMDEEISSGYHTPTMSPYSTMKKNIISGLMEESPAEHQSPKMRGMPSSAYAMAYPDRYERAEASADAWSTEGYSKRYEGPKPFHSQFAKATGVYGEERGNLIYGMTISEHMNVGNFIFNVEGVHKFDNPLLVTMAIPYLMNRCDTSDPWEQMISSDVLTPCNIIIFRPLIEMWMDSFVLMKSGPETGLNVIGNSNMMFSRSSMDKMFHGHFTYNQNCIIRRNENIIIMRNVKTRAIVGGVDNRWMIDPNELKMPADQRGSLIPMLVPITENHFNQILSPSGEIDFPDLNPAIDPPMRHLFSTCGYYEKIWSIKALIDYHNEDRDDFYKSIATPPATSFQGQQYGYDPIKKIFGNITECKGHRKPQGSVPGARAVWEAQKPYFPTTNDVIDYTQITTSFGQ